MSTVDIPHPLNGTSFSFQVQHLENSLRDYKYYLQAHTQHIGDIEHPAISETAVRSMLLGLIREIDTQNDKLRTLLQKNKIVIICRD